VHGLGLTAEEFWSMTPRELAAHESLVERAQRRDAEFMAALYNGPLLRKDKKSWSAAMFLPNYEEVKPTWEQDLETFKAAFAPKTGQTEEEKKQAVEGEKMFADRMDRARIAQRAGADQSKLSRIMQGLE
jgi:hypothetical protein